MKTKNLIALAGWKYQDISEKRIISKRGEIEENLFQNIPGAKEEVIEIEKIWKKSSYQVEMNEDIDAQTVLEYVSTLDKPAIVHIACHGSSTERGGPPTLWLPDKKSHKKYSGLHFESFLRVNWTNCEFLFINACFGAFGEARVGGPILGLQEALIINSIPNFLGPLWPVYDDVAESFAKEFYVHLLSSKNYFDAYLKTYRKLLQNVSENKRNTVISYSFYAL
jgi:CHAT domain-containing protein